MIQVVFVKWGTKYGTDCINRTVRAISRHATCDVRFICITDDPTSRLDSAVAVKPFPRFTAPLDYLKLGCRLKLAIFAQGMLEAGIPALYLDLDTLVRGDVARVRDHIVAHPGIHMLKSHYVPWWPIQHWAGPLIGNKYYHANSSAVGFVPESYYWLFDQFNKTVVGAPGERSKVQRVDDRFISRYCRNTLRVFPASLMVKFSGEYMTPSYTYEAVRNRMPWVRARRQRQVAVTFAGAALKPDTLIGLKPGGEVRYKRLKTRWNHADFQSYWTEPVT